MDIICLFPRSQYDSGSSPDVAVSATGSIVEVHQNQAGAKLYYVVGTLGPEGVELSGSATFYDSGHPPAVAVNAAGVAVEIHQSNRVGSSSLYYHVGSVSGSSVSWRDSLESGKGTNPKIAIDDADVAIEVHEQDDGVACRFGPVDVEAQTIAWSGTTSIAVSGRLPSVAIGAGGLVVIVWEDGGQLHYQLGTLAQGALELGAAGIFGPGQAPSVALDQQGHALLTWAAEVDGGPLIYAAVGVVSGAAITWGPGYVAGPGEAMSVGLCAGRGVMVQQQPGAASYELLVASSPIYDRGSWMGDNAALLGQRSLAELVLPGSHDAGMYRSGECSLGASPCNTRTQRQSIGAQLEQGVRYFDVRPVYDGAAFWTGHYTQVLGTLQGCEGGSLAEVLDDAAGFVDAHAAEVVVLKFSHYYDLAAGSEGLDDSLRRVLIEQVESALAGRLYVNDGATRVAATPLATLSARGSVVIAVFDDMAGLTDVRRGTYSYADLDPAAPALDADLVVFDEYADVNDVADMAADQWNKLADPANHAGDLFLLSWTLTQSDVEAATCVTGLAAAIVDLAAQADEALAPQVSTHASAGLIGSATLPNILYADLASGFVTDVALTLNRQL